LIRVFYTNLKFEGNNLVSHVKGVDMEITYDVWTAAAGLKYFGLKINKGNLGVVEDFNKVQYYKSCLKNQNAQVRTCSVGGLRLYERLLALIVTWILTPRGSNHFVLTEEDLVYIYCIMKKIRINWIHIIKEHMQKEMRLSDYHYPYAVLISKFLLYFEVNLEDETSKLVKSTQELNNGSLSKMGFTKIGGKWITLVPHQVLLLILKKVNMLLIWIFNMKINLKQIKMLDPVLVLEIRKMECKPCFLLRDSWSVGLMALRRTKGISMIYVLAISRALTTGLEAWMHAS